VRRPITARWLRRGCLATGGPTVSLDHATAERWGLFVEHARSWSLHDRAQGAPYLVGGVSRLLSPTRQVDLSVGRSLSGSAGEYLFAHAPGRVRSAHSPPRIAGMDGRYCSRGRGASKLDRELLRAANEAYDVLITVDRRLVYQQNLTGPRDQSRPAVCTALIPAARLQLAPKL
jgi:hypothetical protein